MDERAILTMKQMIILIRHAQSEGNKNREIHQFIPDHRVKLTPDGWQQAEEAGRRLRSMLKPDDTLQFFTSPYRRTRETTEGILKTLTEDDPTPSPFPRHTITVYEEPRLREQDFGNFQPCSTEMERMWQERADYGHFFYRIPNGESAADAYDRVSGFNESLWRQFSEKDFPSVCVIVTHGLMTRVFLMKWYHWSVEYFEDLRNVNHCEFIIMKQKDENGKYALDNQLRTWSELKKRAAAMAGSEANGKKSITNAPPVSTPKPRESSPSIPTRRWGGCVNGCNHAHVDFPRRARRQNTSDFVQAAAQSVKKSEIPDAPASSKDPEKVTELALNERKAANGDAPTDPSNILSPGFASASSESEDDVFSSDGGSAGGPRRPGKPNFLHVGRDFGGSHSGVGTPAEVSDDSDYFQASRAKSSRVPRSRMSMSRQSSLKAAALYGKESGMGSGAKADRLGDDAETTDSPAEQREHMPTPQRGAAMKEAMREELGKAGGTVDLMVEKMKERDRKSMREIY